MSIQDIQEAGEIQRLALKSGDRVVLTPHRPLTNLQAHLIGQAWAAFAPDFGPLFVLEPGMSLSVLSKDDS